MHATAGVRGAFLCAFAHEGNIGQTASGIDATARNLLCLGIEVKEKCPVSDSLPGGSEQDRIEARFSHTLWLFELFDPKNHWFRLSDVSEMI